MRGRLRTAECAEGRRAVRILQTVAVAFSMFSAVPMPQFPWDRDNMRYMLCAFPLVGALIGLLCWGWTALTSALSLPGLIRGAGLCLIPVLITGGVHLDGFCDTWDALASHADPEKKRAILRDPHIGTFAGIHLACWFLAAFALWTELPDFRALPVCLSFVLSRSLSGFAVAAFPIAEDSGLALTFADAADRTGVRAICLCIALFCAAVMCFAGGWSMVLAAAVVFLVYRYVLLPAFGGLSGDLAGWFVQEAELWMLAALFAAEHLEGLL